jgi:hypothetical protein
MITEVMTRRGKVIYVLSESDLDVSPSASSERLRAFCPIHGSDHQRSLSIDVHSGWGYCHCCHSTVLVKQYAPDVAEALQRGEYAGDSASGPPFSADIRRGSSVREHGVKPHIPAARPPWQREELVALEATWPLMREELASWRASAYLEERAIPAEAAEAHGVGYLSRVAWEDASVQPEQRDLLTRWIGRIVFPLGSPDGRGFIGRTLIRWEPGMDENEHKALLEAEDIKRWIKTNPAGWFGPHPSRYAPTLVLVEGGFDRLALIAADVPANAVVALVGTAARTEWIVRFAPQVRYVVLGLDGDKGGNEAMERLADEFRHARADLTVDLCPPPSDGWGKDWSERYRRSGPSGVRPLLDVLASRRCRT